MGHKIISHCDLIYDYVYDSYDLTPRNLDYLQYVKEVRRAEEAKEKHPNESKYEAFYQMRLLKMQQSKEAYEGYKVEAARNLLRNFHERFTLSFIPDAFITPPTSNEHLQKPILNVFRQAFPKMNNLSEYFEKIEDEDENEKIVLKRDRDITSAIEMKERILIIDDVYATGHTVKSIILALEEIKKKEGKSFIVVCPLCVKQGAI